MKKKYLTLLLIPVLTLMSACGPAPEPTLTADDLANTAVANVWAMLTLTQAAIPTATATFIPTETFTPQPTFTFVPLAILPPVNVVVATATSQCNQIPPVVSKGALVTTRFVNKSKGTLNLSFGMLSPNAQGECVTYSYTLGAFDEPVVTVLAGCYWAYAWVTEINTNNTSTAQNIDALCVTDPSKQPDIWITEEVISFH